MKKNMGSIDGNFLIAIILCALFSILWAVWVLPHTVAIRHFAMVFGALIGLYVIFKNGRMLQTKEALAIYGILLLLLWITVHLFFIGSEFDLQLKEYLRVWKKVLICIPFAIGLGLSIAGQAHKPERIRICWKIFYMGLTFPLILFFAKYVITFKAVEWGIANPYFLHDSYYQKNTYAISRALYSFYCIPSFATAVYIILSRGFKNLTLFDSVYFFSILLTPLLFYIEADRMGLLMVFLVLFVSAIYTIRLTFNKFTFKKFIVLNFTVALLCIATLGFTNKFPNWHMTVENTKISFLVEEQDSWKYAGTKPFPINKYGITVDRSNYERISWMVAGSKLLLKYPNGYGLLSLSFDKISKKEWPGSILSMTHSAFLDFALGYGVIGICLLILSFLTSFIYGMSLPPFWSNFVKSGYFALLPIMFFKELSYEITINALIFIILFISAMSTGIAYQKKTSVV